MKSLPSIILIVSILTAGNIQAGDLTAEVAPTPKTGFEQGQKSPMVATVLSAAGFLIPMSMVYWASADNTSEEPYSINAGLAIFGFIGTIVGPGIGHAYAGENGRFWRGAGWRVLCYGGMVVGIAMSGNDSDDSLESGIFYGSIGLYLVSSIYDVVTAGSSADLYNEKRSFGKISVGPIWDPRDDTVGVKVAIGF